MNIKTDYKAGDVVTIVSLPEHNQNITLIGKQGVVNLNDTSATETPLQVYIDGRDWSHLYYFDYVNVEIDADNNSTDLLANI